jgi:hypothetical protein
MKGNRRARRHLLAALLAGGLFLLAGGCSRNEGTVRGTVTYKGQPLTEGEVSFASEKGQVFTESIDKSGHYVVAHIPLGPAKVTVQVFSNAAPPPLSFAAVPKTPGTTGTNHKIPLRYSIVERSGLRHTVTPGKQQFDIDLTE